jgi:hypothetical protein
MLEMTIWISKKPNNNLHIQSMAIPKRPKARGLAQHIGSPGWLEDCDPAGVILYVMGGRAACLFRTIPVALTRAVQLRAEEISSCCYIINEHNHPS